jgi:hypothetical protein
VQMGPGGLLIASGGLRRLTGHVELYCMYPVPSSISHRQASAEEDRRRMEMRILALARALARALPRRAHSRPVAKAVRASGTGHPHSMRRAPRLDDTKSNAWEIRTVVERPPKEQACLISVGVSHARPLAWACTALAHWLADSKPAAPISNHRRELSQMRLKPTVSV